MLVIYYYQCIFLPSSLDEESVRYHCIYHLYCLGTLDAQALILWHPFIVALEFKDCVRITVWWYNHKLLGAESLIFNLQLIYSFDM